MVILKKTCRINGVRPETLLVFWMLSEVSDIRAIDFVVTTIRDGKHSDKSLHYVGQAVDVDCVDPMTREQANKIAVIMRGRLTVEFDVVVEGKAEEFSHWHIEFQPKLSLERRLYA